MIFFFLISLYLFQNTWTQAERQLLLDGLNSSRDSVLIEIADLSENQWQFQEEKKRWSIQYIVEHIFLQDQAYYREVKILSYSPPRLDLDLVKKNDSTYINYATDPTSGIADWDVSPTGRFCSREETTAAFNRLRIELINLIKTSQADFRRIYTFRSIPPKLIETNPEFYQPRLRRDLHQLILNDIAHTKRHLRQIRKVKLHKNFPQH